MNTVIANNPHAKTVLEKALSYLGVDGVMVAITVNARMLDKVEEEGVELMAMTYPAAMDKSFNLFVRNEKVRDVVLCHEAVHIGQYASGRLSLGAKGIAVWMGVQFGSDVPYRSRPWEIEAFGLENKILRKLRKTTASIR